MSLATLTAPFSLSESLIDLLAHYRAVRALTHKLCEPLAVEDYIVQTMNDVSPTKWHLAHTSWFFETFILEPHLKDYQAFHPQFAYLFNSYYIQAGERHCRDKRGYLSRPTVKEVYAYRAHVDARMERLMETADANIQDTIRSLIEIGLHHEQQHQELLLTDIKHVLSVNPLRPVYRDLVLPTQTKVPDLAWLPCEEGIYEVGYTGEGFHYDNEGPRHRVFLEPYQFANRLVTNGEYLAFMEDGGYERAELWLSQGWGTVLENQWTEPFYWEKHGDQWMTFTLAGMQPVDLNAPVTHVSYFEADAYARWAGARLPTEQEWEVAAQGVSIEGNFVDDEQYHPVPLGALASEGPLYQMYGDVWEWTRSQYSPYPGYEPAPGALGEYNGKFMCNQFVLRGGSCATTLNHIRSTYRNFFPPDATWQFMGIRLAKDV